MTIDDSNYDSKYIAKKQKHIKEDRELAFIFKDVVSFIDVEVDYKMVLFAYH